MVRTVPARTVAQLTAIIDSVPTAVIMTDRSGAIVLANLQAQRLFGYSGAELLGQTIDMLVPRRFQAGHRELSARYTEDPRARSMGKGRDLVGLHKDGTEILIEIGLNPVATDEGVFVVSAIVDLSERKRLEARFRATVESAPIAILMTDQAGAIVLVNAELERLFGYDRGELLQQKVEVLVPARLHSAHPRLRNQYLEAPQARRMGAGSDLFGRRKDGSEFPVEIGLNPVRTDEGLFVLAAVADISEREQTKALRRAVEALERSNIELQRFAYVASHDLQTPMRSVASFAELLQTEYADKLDARAQDWLRRTADSARQLQMLVRDLLEYARVDSPAHRFERVPVREVFDHAVLLLDASVREAGAEVSCGELPTVMGARSQLVELLRNLIGNGLKYRGADAPRIRVCAERKGNEWTFAVSDNGIGIAPRHRERIFEMFQRLHDQGEFPGTGIGLAVCRRVVQQHGGRIWVESEPGKGSVFYFTIPEEKASHA